MIQFLGLRPFSTGALGDETDILYCCPDKLSLNYASAYTLIPDLGLEGQRYSWVAAIFNFGYLFWAIPANLLIQKLPVAKYMGGMLVLWSVIVIAHIGAKNYAGILVLRFLLGMAEAGVSPCSKCSRIRGQYFI